MNTYKQLWCEKYKELADKKGINHTTIDQEIAEQVDDFMNGNSVCDVEQSAMENNNGL